MKRGIVLGMAVWVGVALAQGPQTAASSPLQASSAQPVRPIGVVTQIKTGSLTLHTDAGPELLVPLPEGITCCASRRVRRT